MSATGADPPRIDELADALATRLAARGIAEGMHLLDLMRVEQHLLDDLAAIRRIIAAITRSAAS